MDPSLVEDAAALNEEEAAGPPPRARGGGPPREPPVPRGGRARALRRRVRPAVPAARRPRGRVPGPGDARVADPEGRRHAGRRPLPRGPPPAADAVAVERVQPRRAARVRRPRPQGPRPRGGAGARGRADLHRGAQDRRPRRLAALRARPVHARRDPRRRLHGRGRHAQPAHDPRDPGAPGRARDARGAGRGVHAQGRVRADQRRARRGGPPAVRQPAQQRRGLAAPEGPAGHRGPPAHDLAVPARRGRAGRRQPVGGARAARCARLPGQPRPRAGPRHRGRDRLHRDAGARRATSCRTRPTAWWSRSTASTSSSASGW